MIIEDEIYAMSVGPTLFSRIPIGTVFRGNVGPIRSLFLRTYSGVVDLGDPKNDWISTNTTYVSHYVPVEAKVVVLKY